MSDPKTDWPGPEAPLDVPFVAVESGPVPGVRYAWSNEADLAVCQQLAPGLVRTAKFQVYPLWVPYLVNDPTRSPFLGLASKDENLQRAASVALANGVDALFKFVDDVMTEKSHA